VSEPSLALQRGIYATLTSDAAVTALIGQRVFDRITPGASFPYIRLAAADQVIAEEQDCIDECVEVYAQVDVFSRAQGKVEAKNIAGAIARALKVSTITLESAYSLGSFIHRDTRFLDDPDGLSTHAVLTFHALIDGVP
jgi:hypothetical protein